MLSRSNNVIEQLYFVCFTYSPNCFTISTSNNYFRYIFIFRRIRRIMLKSFDLLDFNHVYTVENPAGFLRDYPVKYFPPAIMNQLWR